jgi:hypothetical protein
VGPFSCPSTVRVYCKDFAVKREIAFVHGVVGVTELHSPVFEQMFPWPFMLPELRKSLIRIVGRRLTDTFTV